MARIGSAFVEIEGDLAPLQRKVSTAFGSAPMGKVGRRAGDAIGGGIERGAKRGSNAIERMNGRIHRSFGSIVKRGLAAGAAFGGAFASIAAAKGAITTTEDLARSTLALHRNLGFTIKDASRWAAVARARGIDTSQLAQSFTILAKNTEAALGGNENLAKAFGDLGISQEDAARGQKDFGFLLGEVSKGLGSIEGGGHRAALAYKILGRSAQTTLPIFTQGKKVMNDQLKLADKYGVTFAGKPVRSIRDLIKAQRELEFAQMGLQIQFTQAIAPALIDVTRKASELARVFGDKNLTPDEKFEKFQHILAPIGDAMIHTIRDAIPLAADAAGQAAPKVAKAFVEGFFKAGPLGQLLIGGWIFAKARKLLAAFGLLGRSAGTAFTAGAQTTAHVPTPVGTPLPRGGAPVPAPGPRTSRTPVPSRVPIPLPVPTRDFPTKLKGAFGRMRPGLATAGGFAGSIIATGLTFKLADDIANDKGIVTSVKNLAKNILPGHQTDQPVGGGKLPPGAKFGLPLAENQRAIRDVRQAGNLDELKRRQAKAIGEYKEFIGRQIDILERGLARKSVVKFSLDLSGSKKVSDKQLKDIVRGLDSFGPSGEKAGRDLTRGLFRQMEAGGQLPKGTWRRLQQFFVSTDDRKAFRVEKRNAIMFAKLQLTYANLEQTTKGAMGRILGHVGSALKLLGVTSGNKFLSLAGGAVDFLSGKKAAGGVVDLKGRAFGGQIPGYSRRDDRLIAVRGGEEVLRPEDHAPIVNRAMAVAHAEGKVPFRSTREMFKRTGAFTSGGTVRGFAKGGMVGRRRKDEDEPESLGQQIIQRLVPAEIPQPRALVQQVVQAAGTKPGRESPRAPVERPAESLRTLRIVADSDQFAKGGAVGDQAAQHRAIVALGRRLQKEGFSVGENPAFGGVHPVHVPNSYHYRDGGLALDVNADGMKGGEDKALSKLASQLKGQGWHVLWHVPHHFDHLHVDTASGAGDVGGAAPTADTPELSKVKVRGPKGALKELVQAGADRVQRAGQRLLGRESGSGVAETKGFGGEKGPWQKTLKRIAHDKGWSVRDWEWVVQHESSGKVSAKNPKSTAFGLGQLLDSTYAKYGGGPGSSGAEQIGAMGRYIADRYGNPTKARSFWESHGYYSKGGVVDVPGYAGGGPVVADSFYAMQSKKYKGWDVKDPKPKKGAQPQWSGGKKYTSAELKKFKDTHQGKTPAQVEGEQKAATKERETKAKERGKRKHDRDIKAERRRNRQKTRKVARGLKGRFRSRLPGMEVIEHLLDTAVPNLTDQLDVKEGGFTRAPLIDVLMGREDILPENITSVRRGHEFLDVGTEEVGDITVANIERERRDVTLSFQKGIRNLIDEAIGRIQAAMTEIQKGIEERRIRIGHLKAAVHVTKSILAERRKDKPDKHKVNRLQGDLEDEGEALGLRPKELRGDQGFQKLLVGRFEGELSREEESIAPSGPWQADKSDLQTKLTTLVGGGFGGDRKVIREQILDTETERAGFTREGLTAQLQGFPVPKAGTSERDTAIADLLRQLLERSNRELAISRAQIPVFERFKNAPKFHEGGVVKGPVGAEVPIIAKTGEVIGHAGEPSETILNITLVAEEGAGVDMDKFRVVVNDTVGEMVRKARSGPAPGHKMSFPRS